MNILYHNIYILWCGGYSLLLLRIINQRFACVTHEFILFYLAISFLFFGIMKYFGEHSKTHYKQLKTFLKVISITFVITHAVYCGYGVFASMEKSLLLAVLFSAIQLVIDVLLLNDIVSHQDKNRKPYL